MRAATFFVESPVWNVVIGTFLVVAFGIPSLLVLRGYLTGAECGVARADQPTCLVVVSVFMLGGVAMLTQRDAVTIDPTARSIQWQSSSFGIAYSTTLWSGDDLKSIEQREQVRNRYSAYWTAIFVLGPKGERMLLEDDYRKAPEEFRAVVDALELPRKTVDMRRANR